MKKNSNKKKTARVTSAARKSKRSRMAARKPSVSGRARNVEKYEHPDKKRLNNPPVGLVTPETDPDQPRKTYSYDPHLDPQLTWAGKAETAALELDTVSLHVHERIDPYTIMESVRTKESYVAQPSLFAQASENPPLREALDFYKHQHEWSNRLIAGDSALVMNSMLEKEGMAGQVQMMYVDPPYGVKYKSNFQPFVNRRDVGDKDEDLTQEPEMVRAFRDTWELGIHSYLGYLRDRFILAKDLLAESGSIFVQIGDENLHLVRNLLDEVFGAQNFISLITIQKMAGLAAEYMSGAADYVIWYCKNRERAKYRQLLRRKILGVGHGSGARYDQLLGPDGKTKAVPRDDKELRSLLDSGWEPFQLTTLTTFGSGGASSYDFEFDGKRYTPPSGKGWLTTHAGMTNLAAAGRIVHAGNSIRYLRKLVDFEFYSLNNVWTDIASPPNVVYVVQTSARVIQRCMLMTTDPGDLVLDPTCGSGTTVWVAEQWGRRWITCDTSRVAIALTKQRLMTSVYDYYEIVDEDQGVDAGFRYKTVNHVTLKSIAHKEPPKQEPLYDEPLPNNNKVRVTGPFTVEAVPAPMITSFESKGEEPDATIGRSGATARESDWRAELLKTGVRGLGGKVIKFSRVEPLAGTSFLNAEAETVEEKPQRVVISFGPNYAPLEQRQVEGAWQEARNLDPRPNIVLFAAFQFDPEAAKDIDEMPEAVTKKTTFLKVQMNTDLLTGDLKKKLAANESFWLVGRPDVELRKITIGEHTGKYVVEVHGFDYYDVKSGEIISGNASKIAMWMLDTDYDERSLFPRQVFFPMAGEKDGWAKLAKNLKAEIDEELIEAYRGTVSIPFDPGGNKRVAIKIIDDRGVESLRVIRVQ